MQKSITTRGENHRGLGINEMISILEGENGNLNISSAYIHTSTRYKILFLNILHHRNQMQIV